MKAATIEDKKKVLNILQKAFANNPTLMALIRNKRKKDYFVRQIVDYAFHFSLRRKGVFLSDDGNVVAFCFRYNFMESDLLDLWRMIKMVLLAFSLRKLISTFYHNDYVGRIRPSDGRYLYFWFFGALPEHGSPRDTRSLIDSIFERAQEEELDIYAETTLKKNKTVYERFGFEVYRTWYNPYNGVHVWFMRRRFG